MPRLPHDPDRTRRIADCMRELRRRHDANPRRMYARRVDIFGPVIANPSWYYAVARRFVRAKENA